ncbi:SMI1/KNR4 family protein [Peribacillus sp. NPDC097225]|uniref:SMI1/KNR4 family protein n=1 Tax=Peribacillus sp. NPDC097225 TaxID=3364400 RepID=UPI0037F63C73
MNNWTEKITAMVIVKQEIMKQDVKQIWPHHFPEVATTEEQIAKLEMEIGFKLDSIYRDFLKYANGWKGFYQTVDLFGTEQLKKSKAMDYANSLLNSIEEDVIKESGFLRNQLLPIAATEYDKDLFVIGLPHSQYPGKVIWFAGEEIDRYENFNEYFLAMIDYNREEIVALKS